MIAPMSSKIANDVRKILMLVGTREPSNVKTPSANAISVTDGIAQPFMAKGSSLLKMI